MANKHFTITQDKNGVNCSTNISLGVLHQALIGISRKDIVFREMLVQVGMQLQLEAESERLELQTPLSKDN